MRQVGGTGPLITLSLVSLAVGVLVVVATALLVRRRERATRRRAEATAASHGLRYLAGPESPPSIGFRLLSVGRSRRARHVMWRDGDEHEASVFDYEFTTGSGQQVRTHQRTCAVFRTGIAAPHLVLDRQNVLRQVVGRVGRRGVTLESPAFNRTWYVGCDDERFAVTVLDPPMIDWLTTVAAAGAFEVELLGDRGLVIGPRRAVEELPGLLDLAHRLVGRIPNVVHDLYPWPR